MSGIVRSVLHYLWLYTVTTATVAAFFLILFKHGEMDAGDFLIISPIFVVFGDVWADHISRQIKV